MNWRRITAYAFALFVSQFAIGFLEGFFALDRLGAGIIGHLVAFVVCASIFAHLSFNQRDRPFEHALAALILDTIAGVALSLALAVWIGSASFPSVIAEWLVLILSMLVGTAVGSYFRRNAGQPAGVTCPPFSGPG